MLTAAQSKYNLCKGQALHDKTRYAPADAQGERDSWMQEGCYYRTGLCAIQAHSSCWKDKVKVRAPRRDLTGTPKETFDSGGWIIPLGLRAQGRGRNKGSVYYTRLQLSPRSLNFVSDLACYSSLKINMSPAAGRLSKVLLNKTWRWAFCTFFSALKGRCF